MVVVLKEKEVSSVNTGEDGFVWVEREEICSFSSKNGASLSDESITITYCCSTVAVLKTNKCLGLKHFLTGVS